VRARITAKPPAPRKLTNEQRLLMEQLRPAALARGMTLEAEKVFAPPRKWRIDVALLEPAGCGDAGFAIEIDGGAFIQGRHSRGAGIESDNEKIAAIARYGYRFLRVTPKQVRTGQALEWIKECL
jgi:very-short-patch-repair endonuclease